MAVLNYVFGAKEPIGDLAALERQFRMAHKYRNHLVQVNKNWTERTSALLRETDTALADLHAATEELYRKYHALRAEALAKNKNMSLEKGAHSGRTVVPTVETTAEESDAVLAARQAAEASKKCYWKAHSAAYQKAKKDDGELGLRLEEINLLKNEEIRVGRADISKESVARNCEPMYWGTYLVVNEYMSRVGKGTPCRFTSYGDTDTHWVGVVLQNNYKAVFGQLFVKHSVAKIEDVTKPGSPAERKGHRHVILHMKIANTIDDEPVIIQVPFLLHRPIPDSADVKIVRLGRTRYGTRYKWSVMITAECNPPSPPKEDKRADAVSVKFLAVDSDDGVEVATWHGSDNESGRIVIPNEAVAGWELVEEIQSKIDVSADRMRKRLSAWVREHESAGSLAPLVAKWERVEKDGVVTTEKESMSRLQAAHRISIWKSPKRLHSLYHQWSRCRFGGDEEMFCALGEWVAEYEELAYRLARQSARNSRRRTWLFRSAVKALGNKYRGFYLHQLQDGGKIESPEREVKVHGQRQVGFNKLRRIAACGMLRGYFREGAFKWTFAVTGPDIKPPKAKKTGGRYGLKKKKADPNAKSPANRKQRANCATA